MRSQLWRGGLISGPIRLNDSGSDSLQVNKAIIQPALIVLLYLPPRHFMPFRPIDRRKKRVTRKGLVDKGQVEPICHRQKFLVKTGTANHHELGNITRCPYGLITMVNNDAAI
jgi:nitrite reductase/ring-hydroxylating ferredoxin subunit